MTKQRTKTRYATYSRCSTDDQAHKDFSTIQVQRGLNQEYVMLKGGELVTEYQDEGISGTTLNRPGWKKLLADAQAGLFDTVVVTYMSRLGRGDTCTVAEYLLKESKVKVEMVKEFFTDDVAGFVNKSMTRFVDAMYVENVRQWTKSKMEAMVNEGYHCGGFPAFGYATVTVESAMHKAGKEPPKRLVPKEGEAEIVAQAFTTYAEVRNIARVRDYLNAVTQRTWTTTTVKNLLTNEVYRGIQRFGAWCNETAHEPIVDAEIWAMVQTSTATQGARYVRRREDNYTFYLRGRLVCPHCGCGVTQAAHHGRGGRIKHYYVCNAANRNGRSAAVCPVASVNADRLHRTVLNYLRHASTHRTALHRIIAESGGWGTADDAQKALRGQLGKQKQALEMRIANYVKAIGDGRDSIALMSALDKAEADRQRVIDQMAEADAAIESATIERPTAADVSEAWTRFLEVWEVLDETERADALGAIVQRIELTDKESVTLELLPFPEINFALHSQLESLNSRLGARSYLWVNQNTLPVGSYYPFRAA